MYLIDTHAHLYLEEFKDSLSEIINNCKQNNVKKILMPCIDDSYLDSMIELKKKHEDFFYLMIGIHPTHIEDNYIEKINFIDDFLFKNKNLFIGIGEIGIDLYWSKDKLAIQQDAFEKQLDISLKYHLPINIHCRDAFFEVFEVLEKYSKKNIKGVFHCFSGDFNQAKYITEKLNLKLGIGGIITFKNNKIAEFLNKININNIVLETDSPFLAPAPHRGKINNSSFIPLILEKIVSIYNIDKDKIIEKIYNNSLEIYNLN